MTELDQTGQTGGNEVAEKRVDFGYNAVNQTTTIARYNDTAGGAANEVATGNYTFDTLHRLTGLAYQRGGNNLFTPYAWTYDSLSSPGHWSLGFGHSADPRVQAVATSPLFTGGGRVTQFTSADGTSDYSYDATSQLTVATHSYQTDEAYSFDANGNRTNTGYATGTNNQLTSDGTYSYEYDGEGNRIKRTDDETLATTEYTSDFRNRLTKVTDKDEFGQTTQVVQYKYDLFNRRISRAVDTTSPFDLADAAIESYVYDDASGVASADGSNVVLDFLDPDGSGPTASSLQSRYLYSNAVDQILAQEDVTQTLTSPDRALWHLSDNLGTIRDLAKNDGTLGEHFQYDSFGRITSGNTSLTRYLYTSREYDPAVDLQYNRARWYDTATGRWLSEDPLGFGAGDGNLGRYVGNLSISAVDPTGLWEKDQDAIDRNLLVFDAEHVLSDADKYLNMQHKIEQNTDQNLIADAADISKHAQNYKSWATVKPFNANGATLLQQVIDQFNKNKQKKIALMILDHGSNQGAEIDDVRMQDIPWEKFQPYVKGILFLGCNVGNAADPCKTVSKQINGAVIANTAPVKYPPIDVANPPLSGPSWRVWIKGAEVKNPNVSD